MRDRYLETEEPLDERAHDLFGAAVSVGFGAIGTALLVAIAWAWWLVQW